MTIPRAYQSSIQAKTERLIAASGKKELLDLANGMQNKTNINHHKAQPQRTHWLDQINDIEDVAEIKSSGFATQFSTNDDNKNSPIKIKKDILKSTADLNQNKNKVFIINLPRRQKQLFILIGVLIFYFVFKSAALVDKFERPPEADSTPLYHAKNETWLSVQQTLSWLYPLKKYLPQFKMGREARASSPTPNTPATPNTPVTNAIPQNTNGAKDNKNPTGKKDDKAKVDKEEVQFDPLEFSSAKDIEVLAKVAKEQESLAAEKEAINKKKLMIDVMKKELETKISEMKALKETINTSLNQADKQQKLKLEKFIKIIEGMKTKNAAQILEKMETNVLKELVPQMSPRKISAILDQMPPSKAKDVLILTVSDKNPFSKK